MTLPCEEGTWFAVPLRQGGYGTGVVARHSPDGSIVLAYLFGPKRHEVPSLAEASKVTRKDALKVIMVGALGFIEGIWPIIGKSDSWKRKEWQMPKFVRRDDISRTAWLVTYDENNPNQVVTEECVSFDITGYERDALSGAGAVEMVLTRLLS